MQSSENDRSKTLILFHTLDMVLAQGIKKVKVQDICDAAGLSKMTFYRKFESKSHVICEALEGYLAMHLENYRNLLSSDLSFHERISEVMALKHEEMQRMSEAFLADFLSESDPKLMEVLQNYADEVARLLLDDLRDAQSKGIVNQVVKPELMLFSLMRSKDLYNDPYVEGLYPDLAQRTEAVWQMIYHGILNPHHTAN